MRMLKAKEDWISDQCKDIEQNLGANNAKKAYQVVKGLSSNKQWRINTILDKNGKCLKESKDILNTLTEYTAGLYSYRATGDIKKLNASLTTDTDSFTVLGEEVEEAVNFLKKGKAAGIDNISTELVHVGGKTMIDTLHVICKKIWETGQWPTQWTRFLMITVPKKGNLQQCNNYRIISLICHPSKLMLKIISNRSRPQAEEIIAEEQA